MVIPIYQIDAFSDQVFKGNPAAVCILNYWLTDSLMQNIAAENNLAETAFVVGDKTGFRIRWFTPTVEVDLCGHATLAAAHVIFHHLNFQGLAIEFQSKSGVLIVTSIGNRLTLDFPIDIIEPVTNFEELTIAMGQSPKLLFRGKSDYLLVYKSQKDIENLQPDFRLLKLIKARGIIVTAPGNDVDFVSRFFAPQSGIDEDPVTGSAHTTLAAYWAQFLRKDYLIANQLSVRGGQLICNLNGSRVQITGSCSTFMIGEIFLPDSN